MKNVAKSSSRWAHVLALSLVFLAAATPARTAMQMDDKMPMGGMMDDKMSMSDKKMMPQMAKGMSTSEKSMMMKMMPQMSASDKKTMLGMSLAEKKVCMKMAAKAMSVPANKPAANKPAAKKPMGGMGGDM